MATITQHFPAKKTNRSDFKTEKVSTASSVKAELIKDATCGREEDMKKLKDFDLQWEFGPCIGVTRLERWERANKHGLNPPQSVRDLILNNSEDTDYTESLWHEYNI